jgi:predicted RNase H-like HicB family nuclease/DNA-binding XRE family transcriptional regulator
MTYHFYVHEEEKGFWAECVELTGCVTQAESFDELEIQCKEALNLFLEEPNDSKIVFPLPNESIDSDTSLIKTDVDPEIALAVLLRYHRFNSKLTQKQMAEMLGMKNLYSYQRLEKRSNPTLSIIKKYTPYFQK